MKVIILSLLASITVAIFTDEKFELEVAKVMRVQVVGNETKGERR